MFSGQIKTHLDIHSCTVNCKANHSTTGASSISSYVNLISTDMSNMHAICINTAIQYGEASQYGNVNVIKAQNLKCKPGMMYYSMSQIQA